MANIYVPLTTDERDRLVRLALREYRDAKAQARLLIVEGLERADLDRNGVVSYSRRAAGRPSGGTARLPERPQLVPPTDPEAHDD